MFQLLRSDTLIVSFQNVENFIIEKFSNKIEYSFENWKKNQKKIFKIENKIFFTFQILLK